MLHCCLSKLVDLYTTSFVIFIVLLFVDLMQLLCQHLHCNIISLHYFQYLQLVLLLLINYTVSDAVAVVVTITNLSSDSLHAIMALSLIGPLFIMIFLSLAFEVTFEI